MTIDPSTLPDGTVVEVRGKGSDADLTTAYVFAGVAYPFVTPNGEPRTPFDVPRDAIVRTFSPDPLPSQEVPYGEWGGISLRTRVRVEFQRSDKTLGPLVAEGLLGDLDGLLGVGVGDRLFVLDEPDPDAEAKKALADAVDEDGAWLPETVLANLRDAGFDVVKAGA